MNQRRDDNTGPKPQEQALAERPWSRRHWPPEQQRAYWPHLTLQQVELLKEVFELFDSDGKGYFTKDELYFVMEAMGGSPTPQELDAVMYELDSNGDHMVDFPEFLAKFLTATDEKELLSVFSQLAIREGEDERQGGEGARGEGGQGEGGGGGGGDRMLTPAAVERSFQYVGDPLSEQDKKYLGIIWELADKDGNGRLDVKEFTAFLEKMDADVFMESRYQQQQQQQQPASGGGGHAALHPGQQCAGGAGGGGGRSSRSVRAGGRGGAVGSGEDDGDGGRSSPGARSSTRGQGSVGWLSMGGVARQGSGDMEAGPARSSSVGPPNLRSSILARFTRTAKGAGRRGSMESNVSMQGEQHRVHSAQEGQQHKQQQHRSSSSHVQMQDMSGHRADRGSDGAGSGASTPRAAAAGASPRHWLGGRASAFAGAAPLGGSVSVGGGGGGGGQMAVLADGADGLARVGSAGSRLVLASPPSAVVMAPSAPSSFNTAASPPPVFCQGASPATRAPGLGPGQGGHSGQSQGAASAGAAGTPRWGGGSPQVAGAWEAAAAAAAEQYSGATPGRGGSGGGGGSPRVPAEGASGGAAAHAGAGGPSYGRSGSGGWARSGGAFVGTAAAEAGGRTGPVLGNQHLEPQEHRRPPPDLQTGDYSGPGASVPASDAHAAPHHQPPDPPWHTPRASSHPSSPAQVHSTSCPPSPAAAPSPRPTSPHPTEQSAVSLATRRHQHAHQHQHQHQHHGAGPRSCLRSPAEVRRHPSTSVIQESPEEDDSLHGPSTGDATAASALPVSTQAEVTEAGTMARPGGKGPGGHSRPRSSGSAAEGHEAQAAVGPAPNSSLFMRLGSLPSRLSSWAGPGGGGGSSGGGVGVPLRIGSGGDGRREAPASPASPGGTRLSGLLGSVFGRQRSLGRDPRDGMPPAAWGRHVAGHGPSVRDTDGELPMVDSPLAAAATGKSPGTGPPSPPVVQLSLPAQRHVSHV